MIEHTTLLPYAVKERNAWPAAVALIVAIACFTVGYVWTQSDGATPTSVRGFSGPSTPQLTPTATAGTVSPILVILATTAPPPTIKPMPTYTAKPFCIRGQATPGAICMGPPHVTVTTATPVPTCPVGTPVAEFISCIWMGT